MLLFLLTGATNLKAQPFIDSVDYHVAFGGANGTGGYLPHWISSNRFGVLDETNTSSYLRAGMASSWKKNHFSMAWKVDLIGKSDFSESGIQELYVRPAIGPLELKAGWIEETVGMVDSSLSSGSLAWSSNARPLPIVGIGFPTFTKVPFTGGYLKIKGFWGHGWFGNDRYITNSWLHQKYVYLQAGGNLPVRASAGFVHNVVWGGTDPVRGDAPDKLSDYFRVIRGKSANKNEAGSAPFRPERLNALGNHLGIWDFRLDVDISKYQFSVYHQTPYDDRSSMQLFLNPDRLLGVAAHTQSKDGPVTGVVYEYINTKYQSGPGTPDTVGTQSNYGYDYGGRDDYYNNNIYLSGWTNQSMVLGNPLFITSQRAQLYLDSINDFGNSIVSNRFIAHHLGIEGRFSPNIGYRFLGTFTQHFGTYAGLNNGRNRWDSIENPNFEYRFREKQEQLYLLLEISRTIKMTEGSFEYFLAVAYDHGDLDKNGGLFVGAKWLGLWKKKNKTKSNNE